MTIINQKLWFSGFVFLIVISIKTSYCQQTLDNCTECYKEGLKAIDCEGKYQEKIPSVRDYIEFLDLKNCRNLQLRNNNWDVVLKRLIRLDLSHIADIASQRKFITLNKFSKLFKLTSFTFSYSNLTNLDMWILPEGLQKYKVDGNNYTFLNLSRCSQLTEVSANYNNLQMIPLFSRPSSVKALYLMNNPMDELTVEDLAPLCNLTVLEMQLPLHSSLCTTNKSCQCKQLQRWVEAFEIAGSSFCCAPLPENMKCDLTFADFKHLRKHCSDADRLPLPALEKTECGCKKKLRSKVFKMLIVTLILTLVLLWFIYYLIVTRERKRSEKERQQQEKRKG